MTETTSAQLEIRNLSVSYGAGPVVHQVNMNIRDGEVAGLLGANGAGKSSILRAIAGLEAARGEIIFEGEDISRLNSIKRFAKGIVYVPEGRAIVTDITVEENLILGSYFVDSTTQRRRRDMVMDFFPEISNRLKSPAGLLSGGEQQMLAIGRGLMSGPKVLLLDEPSLGLAPLLVNRVYERLAKIQTEQQLTALLVEQSFHAAAKLAQKAWVLRHGHIVGELDESSLHSREGRLKAIDAYLGARAQSDNMTSAA